MGVTAEAFQGSIVNIARTFIYVDTALALLFQDDWAMAGYYGMYAFMNIASFLAFFSINN